MLLIDAIVLLVGIGCATTVASMLIGKLGAGRGALEDELRRARDQIAQLEWRNEQLEQQVEWQTRFLRTLEDQRRGGAGDASLIPTRPPAAPDQIAAAERGDEH
jgi:FtsZ-binding cell division protein ZapB